MVRVVDAERTQHSSGPDSAKHAQMDKSVKATNVKCPQKTPIPKMGDHSPHSDLKEFKFVSIFEFVSMMLCL